MISKLGLNLFLHILLPNLLELLIILSPNDLAKFFSILEFITTFFIVTVYSVLVSISLLVVSYKPPVSLSLTTTSSLVLATNCLFLGF